MAKLQTLASRAEAASAMAEAEIALQSLKTAAAPQAVPETGQATQMLQQSTAEFNKRNYGGALKLAHQAKSGDRKSTRLNSSHPVISYAVFCLEKKKKNYILHTYSQ